MSYHKPRIWLMCTVCGKRFSENRAAAKKRLSRKNRDQCCSAQCRSKYKAKKFTEESRTRALEHNTTVAYLMNINTKE